MVMSKDAKNKIEKEALFLEKLGYVKTDDEYSVHYTLNNISIQVDFLRNSEESGVFIRYVDTNQGFSVGWIALVRNNLKGEKGRTENAIELVRYVKRYYSLITNLRYCMDSNMLIDEYVRQHHFQFEKSVAEFLEKA